MGDQGVIYLDTHAAVWLGDGEQSWLSRNAKKSLEMFDVRVSPAVMLELQFLHEKGKVRRSPASFWQDLEDSLFARMCDLSFSRIVSAAAGESWTRDPFDRLIVAHAKANDAPLITADAEILKHYPKALC